LTRRILLTGRHCELNMFDPVDVHLSGYLPPAKGLPLSRRLFSRWSAAY
jgi:hypothetical protein